MNEHYAYTPYIWPSVFMFLLLIGLVVYSWRRRSLPGAVALMIACLFAAAYATGSALELATIDLATKIYWSKFQSCVSAPIVIAVTCFILEYAWPGRWLTRRNVLMQAMIPLIYLGLALTNDFHHLAWAGFQWIGSGPIQQQLGPISWFFIFTILAAYGLTNLLVFGWLYLRSPQHRWSVGLMTVGQLVGRTLYILVKAHVFQFVLPLELLGMGFEFLMYAIALFGLRIFDPIPMGHQTAIEQLSNGVLVLDSQGNIASLNPAAERILRTTAKAARGKPIHELLPVYPAGQMTGLVETEMSLGTGQAACDYVISISRLNDWRGLEAGRLLMLRDVTEQKQAQTRLLEQQRALAMLHEREQLARELHDSIGQVLAYASLKMSAARKLIADGKLVKADEQLAHLEGSLTEAHADVREYILNLRIAPVGDKPFFAALQNYLDGFCQNYGLHVDVSIGPNVGADAIAPEAQVQLFRILQEALSNARKHAQANSVQVSFERRDGLVQIRIQDQGCGFDPLQVAAAGSDHYGLRIMRERAEQLDGALRVQSAPGEGTCIVLDVPVSGKAGTR